MQKKRGPPPASTSGPKIEAEKIKAEDGERIVIEQVNPKSEGSKSFERYEKYKKAKTVGEAIALGAVKQDIAWDMAKGYIKRRKVGIPMRLRASIKTTGHASSSRQQQQQQQQQLLPLIKKPVGRPPKPAPNSTNAVTSKKKGCPPSGTENKSKEIPSSTTAAVSKKRGRPPSSTKSPPASSSTTIGVSKKRGRPRSSTDNPPKAAPSSTSTGISKKRGPPKAEDSERIVIEQVNPKSEGSKSFERYEKYKKAKTVGEAIALGAVKQDIAWDMAKGYIKRRKVA